MEDGFLARCKIYVCLYASMLIFLTILLERPFVGIPLLLALWTCMALYSRCSTPTTETTDVEAPAPAPPKRKKQKKKERKARRKERRELIYSPV